MQIACAHHLYPFPVLVLIQVLYFQGHDHTTFNNVFTPDLPGVKVSRNGWGDFTCARGGVAVWTLASNVAGCV